MWTSGVAERNPVQLSTKNTVVADLHQAFLMYIYRRDRSDERIQRAVKNYLVILFQVANRAFQFPGNRTISASGLFQNPVEERVTSLLSGCRSTQG